MSDDAIYLAGLAVLAQYGSEGLTLVRVAKGPGRDAGGGAAALRFQAWVPGRDGADEEPSRPKSRFAAARAAFSSPLEALQAAFVAELDLIGDPKQVAHAFSATPTTSTIPRCGQPSPPSWRRWSGHIDELLTEAAACGEIAGPVTSELVSTVLAAVEGTMLLWAIVPRGDIKAADLEAVKVALGGIRNSEAPIGAQASTRGPVSELSAREMSR